MLRLVVIPALIALASCYSPELRDCTVSCASADDCASGQLCTQGYCVARTFTGSCTQHVAPADAMADAAPPDGDDAAALCERGCTNGACDAHGVCVIDCSASGSCDQGDVVCPTNLPCRVICGDHACMHHVQCAMSASCEVQCTGEEACGDVIQCGTGPCTVTCSGDSSCHKHTECGMSCSCDVTCSGDSSCGDPSRCPMAMKCVLGRGCSSLLPGCDACP